MTLAAVMTLAVDLDHQIRRRAAEVHDERADLVLPAELQPA